MKAILVIDMPKDCTLCPCYDSLRGNCNIVEKRCESNITAKQPWCLLKPLPEKKYRDIENSATINVGYIFGWNECLEEIEK